MVNLRLPKSVFGILVAVSPLKEDLAYCAVKLFIAVNELYRLCGKLVTYAIGLGVNRQSIKVSLEGLCADEMLGYGLGCAAHACDRNDS